MRSIDRGLLCIVATVCIGAFVSSDIAIADRVGNGGDAYADQFVTVGYQVLAKLSRSSISGVDIGALAQAIATTKVNSEDSLKLEGNDVSAINYPDPISPHIEISRVDWDLLEDEPFRKSFLVLHEYLGIMKVDDSRYQLSSQLDAAKVCSRTPVVREAIESETGITCDRMIVEDLQRVEYLTVKNIESFQPGDFFGLPNLRQLSLDGTFTSIPPGIFDQEDVGLVPSRSSGHIAEVFVSSSRMKVLNPDAFSDLPKNGENLVNALELTGISEILPYNFAQMPFAAVELRSSEQGLTIDQDGFSGPLIQYFTFGSSTVGDLSFPGFSCKNFNATEVDCYRILSKN